MENGGRHGTAPNLTNKLHRKLRIPVDITTNCSKKSFALMWKAPRVGRHTLKSCMQPYMENIADVVFRIEMYV